MKLSLASKLRSKLYIGPRWLLVPYETESNTNILINETIIFSNTKPIVEIKGVVDIIIAMLGIVFILFMKYVQVNGTNTNKI